MITGVQILGIIFGFFMIYFSFLHFKRGEFNLYQLIIWETLWFGFSAAVIFPDKINIFTERLGITRAFDLFAIVAFIVVLSLSFHNYVLLARLEKKIEKQVRDQALNQLPK